MSQWRVVSLQLSAFLSRLSPTPPVFVFKAMVTHDVDGCRNWYPML